MSNSKPILGYWKIRALAQPIRFLLAYIGVDYEDKTYSSREEWFDQDKPNLGLEFPNIPYWIEGELRLTESKAILKHLAREKGQHKNVYPTKEADLTQSEMLESVLWDVWFSLIRMCFSWTDDLREIFKNNAPTKFGQISKYLGSKKFLLGEQVTYVDFIFYEMLHHFVTYDADYLKPYPNIEAFKANFEKIPEIATYMKSDKYIAAPCIAPIAKHPI